MKKVLATADDDQNVANSVDQNRFFPPDVRPVGNGRDKINAINRPAAAAQDEGNGNQVVATEITTTTSAAQITTRKLIRTKLKTLAQIGEDWLYLALLGIIMALISFSMDTIISLFLNTRLRLYQDLNDYSLIIQYVGWCLTPIVLVSFSSGFVHLCSPTAIGSGIPEMKTILRGVVLNEYLTFRTLIAKIVGLTFTLGSGLPLGKEGPSVHMASIVATLLGKLIASFQGIYENESRTSEMLSAACAVVSIFCRIFAFHRPTTTTTDANTTTGANNNEDVQGVAATFYAPIGGVLFSIEVTTVYFAVKNYWRGFFAACCGATVWRLLGFWIKNDESISALFKTNFRTDYPFDPVELIVFSFIGASCGLAGAAYIKFHREIVQFFRRHKRLSEFLQQNRFVYPVLVTLIITTATFPPFLGKYTASTLNTHTTIEHLFSNQTWSSGIEDMTSKRILDEWTTPDTSFYLHLALYIAMLFWTSALASTIPIPSGLFIPVLKMGAAYGRLLGELMHLAFPNGIKYGKYVHSTSIIPGSYAVVGAAAFSGAVTHTISTSVILFEMTGQIVHIIPVILGVLIANAVCQSLQPSIYDSIIEIKKLPYLPPIASSNSISHKILVRDFMNQNLAYVWKKTCTYQDVKNLLATHKKLISFPLVECPESMKLLGSVPRSDLLKMLYLHLGRERRLQEVHRRNSDTIQPPLQHLTNHSIRSQMNISAISNDGNSVVVADNLDTVGKSSNVDNSDSSSSTASSSPSCSPLPTARQTSKLIPQSSTPSITYGSTSTPAAEATTLDEANPSSDRHVGTSTLQPPDCSPIGAQKPLAAPPVDPSRASFNISLENQLPAPPPKGRPTKSILKISSTATGLNNMYKSNLMSNQSFNSFIGFNSSHYEQSMGQPNTASRGNGNISINNNNNTGNNKSSNNNDASPQAHHRRVSIMMGDDTSPIRRRRKVRLPRLRVIDMTQEEQEHWEREQLSANIDISVCQIDEAPFQLVEQTSLYRVHTLFSMLGLNHAYVTSFGRLVGVIALKDMRKAIEKMLQGW